MQTVINPGLVDRADSNPTRVYRLMMPSLNGQATDFSTVCNYAAGQIIPNVSPLPPPTMWAQNSRFLGVTSREVLPPDPLPGSEIRPGNLGQGGGGMSVLPVIDVALLPNSRIPKRNGGTGSNVDCWFFLERRVVEVATDLRLHFDIGDAALRISHGAIEPAKPMKPWIFRNSLLTTSPDWVCLNH